MSAAQNVADRIQAAATAGQGVGQQFLDRAAQLTGPRAFEAFMSPYQEQVIDTTRRELEQQLQRQQAELGASAGSCIWWRSVRFSRKSTSISRSHWYCENISRT